jgi:hypothetical protein
VQSRKVFVVGTGRSGTHWLGWTLNEHPHVRATIEVPAIFTRVTEAAIDPRIEAKHLGYLRRRYSWEHLRSLPRHYVDKSHPNLWHVERLADYFPRARFVAMRRQPYPTIASMLHHRGVMAWHDRWRDYPVPNRFLGITDPDGYDDLLPAAKCAMRWKAHSDRIDHLAAAMPDRLIVVEYEDLAADQEAQARRLWDFLGLPHQSTAIEVHTESLEKWRDRLTPDDLRSIDAVLDA